MTRTAHFCPMHTKFNASRLVYSTEVGRTCPGCAQAKTACICKKKEAQPPPHQKISVALEKKGRAGKTVTVIKGIPLDAAALSALGKEFKAACGSGGTVKDGVIEIQGEHRARMLELLAAQGWLSKS